MVSRRAILLSSLLLGCGALDGLIACGAGRPQPSSHFVSGSGVPLVLSVEPASAGPGSTLTVSGHGFSYVAPENVVSVGGSARAAETYDVFEDGTESLTVTLSEDANAGESALIVIVDGRASNAFPFTVLPTP